ncbi:unnamed protein product [Orchesella dallaii]|uniref:Uncharacterized protein n=1 Tax=Orchesella dallaii TaxID=48710 RepID=A0ABP1QPP1_9HEXA
MMESINWAMVKPQKKTRQFRNGTGSHGAGQKETRTTAPKLTFAKTVKIVHFDPESSTSTRFPEVAVPADGTRRSRRIRFIWRFFLCGSSRFSTDHAKSNLEAYEDKRQTISKTKK